MSEYAYCKTVTDTLTNSANPECEISEESALSTNIKRGIEGHKVAQLRFTGFEGYIQNSRSSNLKQK